MNETKFLTLDHIERICFEYAKSELAHDEPIPPFSSRFPGKLESALASPQRTFGNKSLYPTLERQAAILFYELAKLHPFQNGNKRIAVTTLLYFLHKNKKWLKVDAVELYNFARWVAESNPKLKKETVKAVEKFFETYIVKLSKK